MRVSQSIRLFTMNTLICLAFILLIKYLFRHAPVFYTLTITEDQWGEYLTFMTLLMAGVLLSLYAAKLENGFYRFLLLILALGCFFITGEEISWGQRILKIHTPAVIQGYNLQSEISIHNLALLDPVNHNTHRILSLFIILLVMASVLIPSSWKRRVPGRGILWIPVYLIPYFLLVPYFYFSFCVAKADEISELFLGAAVLIWTIDHLYQHRYLKKKGIGLIVILTGGLTAVLTSMTDAPRSYRLNMMATRDYPYYHMDRQAEFLYQYIYDHPRYLHPETRMNHGKFLIAGGEHKKAAEILGIAIHELEQDTVNASAKHYKRLATTYSLNEDSLNASRYYQKSMRIDSSHLITLTDDNEKAEILLSISESMAMNHDFDNALLKANEAKNIANTPVLRMKIEKWLQRLLENRQSG